MKHGALISMTDEELHENGWPINEPGFDRIYIWKDKSRDMSYMEVLHPALPEVREGAEYPCMPLETIRELINAYELKLDSCSVESSNEITGAVMDKLQEIHFKACQDALKKETKNEKERDWIYPKATDGTKGTTLDNGGWITITGFGVGTTTTAENYTTTNNGSMSVDCSAGSGSFTFFNL